MGLSEEIWNDCFGFPGYEASNFGEVRSRTRVVCHNDGRNRILKGVVLKTMTSKALGYSLVTLRRDGESHLLYVHRVVWEAFNGKIPDDLEINHKNGNRLDNNLENLEVVTHQENMKHSIETGLRKKFVGFFWGMDKENPNVVRN